MRAALLPVSLQPLQPLSAPAAGAFRKSSQKYRSLTSALAGDVVDEAEGFIFDIRLEDVHFSYPSAPGETWQSAGRQAL